MCPQNSLFRADKLLVDGFLRQMDEILGVAAGGDGGSGDLAIVVERQGGLRMLDPSGWSMAGLREHFGAAALFRVERRGGTVRVEGWETDRRCLMERKVRHPRLADLPGLTALPAVH